MIDGEKVVSPRERDRMLSVCFSSPLFPCILDGNDDAAVIAAVSWSRVRLSVVHTRGNLLQILGLLESSPIGDDSEV